MGGLITGFKLGSTVGARVMNHGENDPADVLMNAISIPLGAQLTNPSPARTEISRGYRSEMREERRIPADRGFKALAERMKDRICAR